MIFRKTVSDFIANAKTSNLPVGTIARFEGFTTSGDGGYGDWELTAVTGTPSQTPAQLGNALLNDASGRQWSLVTTPNGINTGTFKPAASSSFDRGILASVTLDEGTNTTVSKKFEGSGRLILNGNKTGYQYSRATARPSTLGNHGSITTAFNGDISQSLYQHMHYITGDASGTPETGYLFTPEVSAEYTYCFNSSGHNNSSEDDEGRTGTVIKRINSFHVGQGDFIANLANIFVNSTKAGSTHFLPNPAGVLYGGSVTCGVDGSNATAGEITMVDGGNDCRGTGFVMGFVRDGANDGGWQNFWSGQRIVSKGSVACDGGYQVVGNWKVAFDAATAEITGAALAMRANQKIEYHAVPLTDTAGVKQYSATLNGWTSYYDTTTASIRFDTGTGNNILQLKAASADFYKKLNVFNAAINTNTHYQVNNTKVVGDRQTAIPNATAGTEVATINAILAAMRAHGLISS